MKASAMADKLKGVSDLEEKMFSGASRRAFFIESMEAKDVDGLLEMFNADDDNASWDSARQKKPQDLDDVLHARLSVAFLASGKGGVDRRYVETELSAMVVGRMRCRFRSMMLDSSKKLVTSNMVE